MEILKPTPEQLAEIMADHKKWLAGSAGKRADLRSADLSGADLRSADLSGADLRSADLSGAVLRSADLSGAVLRSADLSGAVLRSAVLRNADLRNADLRSAVLRSADLRSAVLRSADLSGADLRSAVLRSADLRSADLSGAVLSGADLRSADLSGADLRSAVLRSADLRSADLRSAVNGELAFALTEILPRTGEIYGWKKCRDDVLVHLRVPPEAKRSNATGRKCRAERAEVLAVFDGAGRPTDRGVSLHDGKTEYKVGATVVCHEWCADRWIECAGGVHFYLTREEAVAHTQ